ncbi:MAG: hypothetical protein K8R73_04750 [Clostridiales bacterium]|nr:hypothetical protein [Clostridiales bacterium]
MKIIKIKEFILGCCLIVFSGIIFTFERFISVFKWVGESAPVKISGSGSYPTEPVMAGFFDNLYVPALLILGILLIIMSFIEQKNS